MDEPIFQHQWASYIFYATSGIFIGCAIIGAATVIKWIVAWRTPRE